MSTTGKRKLQVIEVAKARKPLRPAKRSGPAPIPQPSLARTGGNFAQLGMASGREKKYKDTTLTAIEFNSAGVLTLLNGLQTGADATNRVGRRVHWKSIYIRMVAALGSTPTNSPCRMLIVYDKQTNGLVPAATDILLSATAGGLNNLSNRGRFVTLLDWAFDLTTVSQPILTKVVYLRKKFDTVFNTGNTGLVGDIATGSVYALTISQLASGVTCPVFQVAQCRLRFEDD